MIPRERRLGRLIAAVKRPIRRHTALVIGHGVAPFAALHGPLAPIASRKVFMKRAWLLVGLLATQACNSETVPAVKDPSTTNPAPVATGGAEPARWRAPASRDSRGRLRW